MTFEAPVELHIYRNKTTGQIEIYHAGKFWPIIYPDGIDGIINCLACGDTFKFDEARKVAIIECL